MTTAEPTLAIVAANEASFADLQAVFGPRGPARACQCQRYKLAPREAFRSFPAAERAERLRAQTACGTPRANATSGLVAYADGEPVGWCAVEPRCNYGGLVRNNRVPWEGRDEDKADATVWAVTCFFTRAGFRRRGVGRRARAGRGRATRGPAAPGRIEGYPMVTTSAILEELHVGTVGDVRPRRLRRGDAPDAAARGWRIDF